MASSSSKNVLPPKENQPAHSSITAVRIPADGTLPYVVNLQLVNTTSNYHVGLHGSNPLHHSSADDMRDTGRRSSKTLSPWADDALIDIDETYNTTVSLEEKARRGLQALELAPRPTAHSYGNGHDIDP